MTSESKPSIQIDDQVREMTDEEYQSYLADQALYLEAKAAEEAKTTARLAALAKLAALGLTEEEIAAL